jgi:hypothetical protein
MQTPRTILGGTIAATAVLVLSAHLAGAQDSEAVVSKDAISVHRVERGTLTLRASARGTISSVAPARATVRLPLEQGAAIQVGQTCSVQVRAPAVLRGQVAQVERDTLRRVTTAELELSAPLPPGIAVNDSVGALIDVGTADDVVYFERPASARPATTSTIFVLEPDGEHARRVAVVYGRLSGSQLEIIRGLAPGDRVIVTDLPDVAGRDRIALK